MTVTEGPWGAKSAHRQRRLSPFNVLDPLAWEGQPVPPRLWMVKDVVPRRSVTMITGDGGIGKSLLAQQMLTAAALSRNWLEIETQPCRAFGIFCEDEPDELHRRTADICAHYGVSMADLEHLHLMSRVGEDNVLMDFDRRTDHGKPTAFYSQILQHCKEFGAQLVVLDTAADMFAGNENIRPQVRQFVNLLRQLAVAIDGAVVLTAHPSVAGMQTGSGISGSTAWNNTVRSRCYLTRAKTPEGEEHSEERVLKTMKSNYGRVGGEVRLRWEHGVFVRLPEDTGPTGVVDKLSLDNAVLEALRQLCKDGTRVSPDRFSPRAFAKVIQTVPACRSYRKLDIEAAKERLLEGGKIAMVEIGPPSRRATFVRPADMMLPGEEGQLL